MPETKQLTLNTVLTVIIGIMVALLGWMGKETFAELRTMHDSLIRYEMNITDLKIRMAALELDWKTFKERHP